jgi:hypothetical protein
MKTVLLLVSLLATAGASAAVAETTIGPADCLVVSPHPQPKDTVKWSGGCKDGYADGEGNLEWFNNGAFASYYKGTLEHGRPHGKGFWKNAAGSEYEGSFVQGKPDGQGAMQTPNGDRYEGQWRGGARDGSGVMQYALGGKYEGQWRHNVFHGIGKATYAGGQVVEGVFVKGVAPGMAARDKPVAGANYALTDDKDWNWFKSEIVRGGSVPFDKSYAELSHDEQQIVKSNYALLAEGDEPPYPLHGTKDTFLLLRQAISKVQASGTLRMVVMVDQDGNAESVTVHTTPHRDLSKFAADIAMIGKYKPARCSGKPCAMAFPYAVAVTLR